MAKTKSIKTLEDIIMDCSNSIPVEEKVNELYIRWKKRNRLLSWGDVKENHIFASIISILSLVGFASCLYLFADIGERTSYIIPFIGLVACALIFTLNAHDFITTIKKIKFGPDKNKESNTIQFLKDTYTETIKKLNSRLDSVKDKIQEQIRRHKEDKEQVLQYKHILSNTEEAICKIDQAIKDLNCSFDKVSSKKAELNSALDEYIGEHGYLTKKEREIREIKIAQELSDRIRGNFNTTMEITKNVDVLTDTIIPGIKKLIEFRIPDLINAIEFECDKNRVLLEMKV